MELAKSTRKRLKLRKENMRYRKWALSKVNGGFQEDYQLTSLYPLSLDTPNCNASSLAAEAGNGTRLASFSVVRTSTL